MDKTAAENQSANPVDSLADQLKLLDNSKQLILIIMAGLVLQIKSIDGLKEQLLKPDSTPCPDPASLRLSSSLLILYALFGFKNQSDSTAEQACAAGLPVDFTESELSAVVITVALIRFVRLLQASQSANTAAEEELDTSVA